MPEELIRAIVELSEEDAQKITARLLAAGTDPLEILDDCRRAMEVIGKRFENGDCFIPELFLAGDILAKIAALVKPRLQQSAEVHKNGKVIIGTVEGDIHDLAKDMVAFMLDVSGFEVINLGEDVPAAKFVEAAKETGAGIVALSGFLTLAYDPMKATVAALREAGLNVKVMIGGGQVDDSIRQYSGADAYGKDAMAAVAIARQWTGA